MRDSALKPITTARRTTTAAPVGEELMRDSALKLAAERTFSAALRSVGEELMRDSALKPIPRWEPLNPKLSRRRAHARQRFETMTSSSQPATNTWMSEKSSCATAL